MKKYSILFLMISSLFFSKGVSFQKSNEIRGKVSIVNCQKHVTKGVGYNKDGTEILHSDNPLAQPDRNVIISLHPLDFKPELTVTKNAYISQSEQTFIPNILPVIVGSKVHFLNEDEFFHNVQSYTPKSRFSIGRRAPGISYSVKIKKTGIIDLTCDIHPHMNAKIISFETPFFCRVDEDGSYSIKNLPDGKYRLEIFHPHCDKLIDEIQLIGGIIYDVDYIISNKV